MKELIKSISEDLTKSILSENFIDANLLQVKIESSLKVLLSKSKRPVNVNLGFIQDKIARKNEQSRIDAIEKNFWKEIAKTYIGENNIQQYYERLNLILKNEDK